MVHKGQSWELHDESWGTEVPVNSMGDVYGECGNRSMFIQFEPDAPRPACLTDLGSCSDRRCA